MYSLRVHDNWSQQTDREPSDREQTDCEERRLAEKSDPKYIFTIPRAILPKPSLWDEITATKSCNEIIASRSVCCGQLTWLNFLLLFGVCSGNQVSMMETFLIETCFGFLFLCTVESNKN